MAPEDSATLNYYFTSGVGLSVSASVDGVKTMSGYNLLEELATSTDAHGQTWPSLFTTGTESTNETQTTVASQSNAQYVFQIFTIIIGSTATVVNGFVLFCMIYYKHVTKNTTNVFIFNQTILDLIASLGITLCTVLDMCGISTYANIKLTVAEAWFVCLILDSGILYVSPVYASQTSLVVITLERYFKIVHPISHRKYFRQWMVKVGVILPWIMGAVSYVIPLWASTRLISGLCIPYQFPSVDMLMAYSFVVFIILFVIPLVVFLYCYGKIIAAIRRQSQVIVASYHNVVAVPAAAAAAGVNKNLGEPEKKHNPVTKSEKNVIKTTLMVTVSYFVCWFPISYYELARGMSWVPAITAVLYALTAVAYANILLNPVIYAAHFDIIKKTTRFILELSNVFSWIRGGNDTFATLDRVLKRVHRRQHTLERPITRSCCLSESKCLDRVRPTVSVIKPWFC